MCVWLSGWVCLFKAYQSAQCFFLLFFIFILHCLPRCIKWQEAIFLFLFFSSSSRIEFFTLWVKAGENVCMCVVYLQHVCLFDWVGQRAMAQPILFFFVISSSPDEYESCRCNQKKKALASFILSSALHASVFSPLFFLLLLSSTRISASSRLMGQVLRLFVYACIWVSECACVCAPECVSEWKRVSVHTCA